MMWNVNQAQASSVVGSWPIPPSGGITIMFANPYNVGARFQVATASGLETWCAPLTSGVEILWSDLVTNCWPGGSPQLPIPVGTAITTAAIVVPEASGTETTPYDITLESITIQ